MRRRTFTPEFKRSAGWCDGVIEAGGTRFLIKGTLASAVRRVSTKLRIDEGGAPVAEIDTYRTKYEMNVRCLRSDGSIENYSSAEPEADSAATQGERCGAD